MTTNDLEFLLQQNKQQGRISKKKHGVLRKIDQEEFIDISGFPA